MAVLSENKQVISVAFTALLKTLKSDPKMINIIYKILTMNDGEKHKDDNDNAIKYLESNEDSLVNLAEKYYNNLVQALTNNAIVAAVSSSPNPALSLPQSSYSTFTNPYNQIHSHRIEESESVHNSKGNIGD